MGKLNGCLTVIENSASEGSQSALQTSDKTDFKGSYKQDSFFSPENVISRGLKTTLSLMKGHSVISFTLEQLRPKGLPSNLIP